MPYRTNLPCRLCSAPVYRKHPKAIIGFLCDDCHAKRKAEIEAEHQTAVKGGLARAIEKAERDYMFDEHRKTGHLDGYRPACEPCCNAKAVNSVVLEDTEEVPRALK